MTGEVFSGRFELVDLIDEGGMGSVWRAWDRRDREYVAAKVLRQSDSLAIMRFIRESSWRIEHPHVLAPRGWVGEDDRVLVSLPLIEGGTLATVLDDHGAVPWRWFGPLVDQLLSALSAVHAAKIVHRDVKPQNVLLDPTGQQRPHAYVSDFGIAWAEGDVRLTRASEVVGTRTYQSPAALAGAPPSYADDLYALGIVVCEALTRSVDVERLPAPLVMPVRRLLGLDAPFGSASAAREAFAAVSYAEPDAEPVEVFNQLGELPPGWGAGGRTPVVAPPPEGPSPPPARNDPPPLVGEPAKRDAASEPIAWRGWLIAAALGIVGVAFLVAAVLMS